LQVYELLTARSTNKRGESALQKRERIAQSEAQLPAAAVALSQTLLAPVAKQLGSKRLVLVADGALQYIPFAMLPEPSVVSGPLSGAKNNGQRTTSHGQPLIVNHEVVSLPSASALRFSARNSLVDSPHQRCWRSSLIRSLIEQMYASQQLRPRPATRRNRNLLPTTPAALSTLRKTLATSLVPQGFEW